MKDAELDSYKEQIGEEVFRKLYHRGYAFVKNRAESNLRFSGKNTPNSEERISKIKEKYKNGIPKKEIESWINSIV